MTDIKKSQKTRDFNAFLIFALVCLIIKIIAAMLYRGHETDMGCFFGWSEMLADSGLGEFYKSDTFTDYPPGYMYILKFIGILKNVFNISDGFYYTVLKIPAILCDVLTGFLIYRCAKGRFSQNGSMLLSGLYMLNPAVIVNSSLWGQVDSVYTLGLIGVFLLLCNRRLLISFFVFAVCVFIKPQSLIFTPVLLFSSAEYVFLPKFDKIRLLKVISGGFGAILLMVIIALPFGLEFVIKQYVNTLGSYPYMTVNAFNVWGALGQNWTDLTPYFSYLSTAFLVVITLLSAVVWFKNRGKSRYFLTAAFLGFATFMFSVKMHDRYAFPVIAMLLLAFLFSKKKNIFLSFLLVTLSQLFNTAWVLFVYEHDINYYAHSGVINLASVINILIFGYFAYMALKLDFKKLTEEKPTLCDDGKLSKKDLIIVFSVAFVYSVFAFCDLGDMKTPESSAELTSENQVIIEFENEEYIESVFWYLGAEDIEDDMTISCYDKDGAEVYRVTESTGDAFFWNESELLISAEKLVIETDKDSLELFEVVLKNDEGVIPVKSCNFKALADEQELLPERVSFRNSTYFDEIYHARTGYEFVKGKEVYEWTHPPLGKVFIASGIKLFGMNPFGWRITGTLFGVLMVFLMYVLVKKIFKDTFIAAVGCIMFTFDFMHFTQTRIATIDVYVTFFIMMMYYFMYKYYTFDFEKDTLKESFKPLLLAGISFGLGAASKWTAMYACAGLAVIFFITVIRRHWENKQAFFGYFVKTCSFCVLTFIVIPIVIYCLSYIPYMNAEGDFSFSAIWDNQVSMLTYHGETVVGSTHPFSSKWFSWPVIFRPMWYYEGYVSQEIKEGISAFGNPAVWWLGIPSFFTSLYLSVFKRNKNALFILIGYLSCLLPWVAVERTTYIYHYFPCVIFSVLMTCLCVNELEFKYKRYAGVGISVAVVILFLLFYPVLSGEAVAVPYVDEVLRWMDSWVLIG